MKLECIKYVFFLSVQAFILSLAFAAEVNLSIDNQIPQVGDEITVSVGLTGFPVTHGGGLDLAYNRNVLRATSVQVNPTWGFVNKNGTINNGTGNISNILFSDFAGKTGDMPVAVIKMEVINPGDANISATESVQFGFAGSDFGRMSITINNSLASLSVQGENIPETQEGISQTAPEVQSEVIPEIQEGSSQTAPEVQSEAIPETQEGSSQTALEVQSDAIPETQEGSSQTADEGVSTAGRAAITLTGQPVTTVTAVADSVAVSGFSPPTNDLGGRTRTSHSQSQSRSPVSTSAFETSFDKVVRKKNTDRVASGTDKVAAISGLVTIENGAANSLLNRPAEFATDNVDTAVIDDLVRASTSADLPLPNNVSSMTTYMMVGLSLAGIFGIIAFRRATA